MSDACTGVCGRLDDYLAGELPAPQVAEVSAHLASCPGCAAELACREELRAALRTAVSAVEVPPASAVLARLEAKLDAAAVPALAPAVQPRRRRSWALAAAAGVAFVAGMVVDRWLVERPPGGPGGAPQAASGPPAGRPASRPRLTPAALRSFDIASQHDRCAVRRRKPATMPVPLAEAQLAGYRGLLPAIDYQRLGYRLLDAHVCPSGDHRLGHLILAKDGRIVSIFVTAEPDEAPSPQTTFEHREVDSFEIDKVALGRNRGYVVADAGQLSRGDDQRLVASLDRYLEGLGSGGQRE